MKAVTAMRRHVATQLWQEFKATAPDVFRFKHGRRWRMSFGSPLFMSDGEEYRMTIPATKAAIALSKADVPVIGAAGTALRRQYRKELQAHFAEAAHNAVFCARMGGACGATVATNTRQEAAGYRVLEGRRIYVSPAEWAMLRSIPLPALRSLTATQAMAVREEAQKAMPAFRAKLQPARLCLAHG
jgi:hypothetical protein